MQTTLFDIEPDDSCKRKLTNRFYEDVRKEYARLSAIRKNGKRLYSNEYILRLVAEKFYRAERTIENIVFYRV